MTSETASLAEKQRFFEQVRARLGTKCPGSDYRLLSRERDPWIKRFLDTPWTGLYMDGFKVRRPMYLGFYSRHERSEGVFQQLHKRKSSIQQAFDEPLQWLNPSVDGTGINIVIEVPFDMNHSAERQQAVEWACDRLSRFEQVFPI